MILVVIEELIRERSMPRKTLVMVMMILYLPSGDGPEGGIHNLLQLRPAKKNTTIHPTPPSYRKASPRKDLR